MEAQKLNGLNGRTELKVFTSIILKTRHLFKKKKDFLTEINFE
ncbi:hypothetical protein BACSP_01068 [Bacillus sp. T2.9-1]|nr:hypothetical protein BACSP_01068 [Bacillus sp. T2.9-1]